MRRLEPEKTMRTTPIHRRTVVSGLLAGLVVSASGGRAQTSRVPVRVGVIPIIGAAPLFVAHGEGWLRQAGLDLTITTFESGPNMIQALASGTIDVYVAGVAPLGVARARGVDVKVVASTAIGENVVAAGPRLARHFAPGVSSAQALARYRAETGKPVRLATQPPGSVPNTVLQYWLWEQIKADRADVEIVTMGIDATQQAILADAVEGGIVREPALSIIQHRNPAVKVVAVGDEVFPDQPGTVVAVAGKFLAEQPKATQALVDGLVRSVALLTRDVPRATPHVAAGLGRGLVDPALIGKALTSPATKFVIDPRRIVEPSKTLQAYQVKLGSLAQAVPLDALFEHAFFVRAST
jgi:NitT/TauT family transport system substrate-binding protein